MFFHDALLIGGISKPYTHIGVVTDVNASQHHLLPNQKGT